MRIGFPEWVYVRIIAGQTWFYGAEIRWKLVNPLSGKRISPDGQSPAATRRASGTAAWTRQGLGKVAFHHVSSSLIGREWSRA